MRNPFRTPSTVAGCSVLVPTLLALALSGCDPASRDQSEPPDATAPAGEAAPLTYDEIAAIMSKDPFTRARELGTRLPRLGPESLPAVREALAEAAHLDMGAVEFGLLMHYWSLHEPAKAGNYALNESPRGYRVSAIYNAVTHWVREDPQDALPQVELWSKAEGDYGTAAQVALVRGWYRSGEPGLAEYIHGLGPTFERQRALRAYTIEMVRDRGSEALTRWAESVAEDDAQYELEVYRATGPALAAYDVEAAKSFCDAHCEEQAGSSLRIRIAERWGRHDPRAALDWLGTTPKGKDTEVAVRFTYANWSIADREEAMAWMAEQIGGTEVPERDAFPDWLLPTVPIHAKLVGEESPLEGIAWTGLIEDEDNREWMVVEIARLWRERAPEAADAWIDQSAISQENKIKLRREGPGWRRRLKNEPSAGDEDNVSS